MKTEVLFCKQMIFATIFYPDFWRFITNNLSKHAHAEGLGKRLLLMRICFVSARAYNSQQIC